MIANGSIDKSLPFAPPGNNFECSAGIFKLRASSSLIASNPCLNSAVSFLTTFACVVGETGDCIGADTGDFAGAAATFAGSLSLSSISFIKYSFRIY